MTLITLIALFAAGSAQADETSQKHPIALGPSFSLLSVVPVFGLEATTPIPIGSDSPDSILPFFPGFVATGVLVPTSGKSSIYAEAGIYMLVAVGLGGGYRFDREAPFFWHVFVGAPVPLNFESGANETFDLVYITPYWRPRRVGGQPWKHEFGLSLKWAAPAF